MQEPAQTGTKMAGTIVSGASKQTQASQFTQKIPDKNQSNLGVYSSWVQLQMQGLKNDMISA